MIKSKFREDNKLTGKGNTVDTEDASQSEEVGLERWNGGFPGAELGGMLFKLTYGAVWL